MTTMTYNDLYMFLNAMADRARDVYDVTKDEKDLFHFSNTVGALVVVSRTLHPWPFRTIGQ